MEFGRLSVGESKKLRQFFFVRVCRLDEIALTEEWNLAATCEGEKKPKAIFFVQVL